MLTEPVFAAVVALVGAAIVDLVIVHKVTVPNVRKQVMADVEALLAKQAGATLVGQRWGKAAEKERTRVAIFTELAKRIGPIKAKAVMAVIPKSSMDAALRAGAEWVDVLEPALAQIDDYLSAVKESQADPATETQWRPA